MYEFSLFFLCGVSVLRCTICCRCFALEVMLSAKMYDLLPLLWFRSGVPVLRCKICYRCFGLEVVHQCQDERFVAVALVLKWCPNAKMYDLLPLL